MLSLVKISKLCPSYAWLSKCNFSQFVSWWSPSFTEVIPTYKNIERELLKTYGLISVLLVLSTLLCFFVFFYFFTFANICKCTCRLQPNQLEFRKNDHTAWWEAITGLRNFIKVGLSVHIIPVTQCQLCVTRYIKGKVSDGKIIVSSA